MKHSHIIIVYPCVGWNLGNFCSRDRAKQNASEVMKSRWKAEVSARDQNNIAACGDG